MKKILSIILVLISLESFGQINIFKGLNNYDINRVSAFTARSIPDRNYVDSIRNKIKDSLMAVITGLNLYNITTNGSEILGYRSVNQTGTFGIAPTTGSSVLWTNAGKWHNWFNGTSYEIVERSSSVATNTVIDGTHTGTLSNVSNVASSTVQTAHYIRVGSRVFVSGSILVTPTTGGSTNTQFTLTPPIASNFTTSTNAAGTFTRASGSNNYEPGTISADATTDTIVFIFIASDASPTSRVITYSYSYTIL